VAEVQAVLGALGWTARPPDGAGAVRERWESLAALVSVAEDLAAASDRPIDLSTVVAELERRAEAQHVPSAQGVTVSTLHSAKGLEWDAVALFGAQEGTLPFVLATRPDEVAEERRLLYVGLTRAREHLHVSWSRTRGGGQATRKPSRFLDPLLPAALRSGSEFAARGQRTRKKGTILSAHCRTCGHALGDAAERKIGRHADCPATYDERTLALLKEWRKQQAAQEKVPAFCVFTDATLVAIAEARPGSEQALIKLPGLGQAKLTKYGEQLLAILAAAPEMQ
jgi:DNA helicase-2/ATP-dependent DNA helicase PcrA